MSSVMPANFQSNHSTPSQGDLIADMSYSSSPGHSPILNSKFASTPIPESTHQAQEEWERPHPPTPRQRLSDSAYFSDQSVQPESFLHRDEVERLNLTTEMHFEPRDESSAEHNELVQQNAPISPDAPL